MNNDTIICSCYGVTIADVENAIQNGATSFEEVQEITGFGTGCGECLNTAHDLVMNLLHNKH